MLKQETYCTIDKTSALSIADSKIVSVRRSNVTRTGLRVYDGKNIGVAGALGKFDVEQLKEQAKKGLELGISYPYAPSGKREEEVLQESPIDDVNELVAMTEETLARLRKYEDFNFAGLIHLIDDKTTLKNDDGLDLSCHVRWTSFGILFKVLNSGNIFDGGLLYSGRHFNKNDYLEMAETTLAAFKNKVDVPKGKRIPVLWNAKFKTMDHVLNFFSKALNGRTFATGGSILSDKRGKKAFDDKLTLYQSNDPEIAGRPFFDGEGTINDSYRFTLIKEGVVIAPYTDKKNADTYDLPLTGAASCSYDSIPALGSPFLELKSGEKNLAELLNGRLAIYMDMSAGGDFTPDGHYAAPAQLAYLFDGERFVGRLPQLQVSSSVFDMFGSAFIGVSKDKWPFCSNGHVIVSEMEVDVL